MIQHAAVLAHGTDHIRQAIAHIEACNYQLYGIVQDWKAAYDLLQAGLVSVIVVAGREIWAPRIEYAEADGGLKANPGRPTGSRWRRGRMTRH